MHTATRAKVSQFKIVISNLKTQTTSSFIKCRTERRLAVPSQSFAASAMLALPCIFQTSLPCVFQTCSKVFPPCLSFFSTVCDYVLSLAPAHQHCCSPSNPEADVKLSLALHTTRSDTHTGHCTIYPFSFTILCIETNCLPQVTSDQHSRQNDK